VGLVSAAWKLRVGVYGVLALVAVLVLTGRPSANGQKAARVDTYSGYTAQGARLQIDLTGRRFSSLSADGIWAPCPNRPRTGTRWNPTGGQVNVSVRRHGSEFTVHEWPDPRVPQPPGRHVNLWLRGSLNWDVHRIDGVITYFETGARGNCASGPIRFGVSR
jgi:hypothetical protein